jgi:hypothetical protein
MSRKCFNESLYIKQYILESVLFSNTVLKNIHLEIIEIGFNFYTYFYQVPGLVPPSATLELAASIFLGTRIFECAVRTALQHVSHNRLFRLDIVYIGS